MTMIESLLHRKLGCSIEEFFIACGSKRENVCIALGYFPPWLVAEMYGTHGLHPLDMYPRIKKDGLRMDWTGLECELQRICGMNQSSAKAMIQECRRETFEA